MKYNLYKLEFLYSVVYHTVQLCVINIIVKLCFVMCVCVSTWVIITYGIIVKYILHLCFFLVLKLQKPSVRKKKSILWEVCVVSLDLKCIHELFQKTYRMISTVSSQTGTSIAVKIKKRWTSSCLRRDSILLMYLFPELCMNSVFIWCITIWNVYPPCNVVYTSSVVWISWDMVLKLIR